MRRAGRGESAALRAKWRSGAERGPRPRTSAFQVLQVARCPDTRARAGAGPGAVHRHAADAGRKTTPPAGKSRFARRARARFCVFESGARAARVAPRPKASEGDGHAGRVASGVRRARRPPRGAPAAAAAPATAAGSSTSPAAPAAPPCGRWFASASAVLGVARADARARRHRRPASWGHVLVGARASYRASASGRARAPPRQGARGVLASARRTPRRRGSRRRCRGGLARGSRCCSAEAATSARRPVARRDPATDALAVPDVVVDQSARAATCVRRLPTRKTPSPAPRAPPRWWTIPPIPRTTRIRTRRRTRRTTGDELDAGARRGLDEDQEGDGYISDRVPGLDARDARGEREVRHDLLPAHPPDRGPEVAAEENWSRLRCCRCADDDDDDDESTTPTRGHAHRRVKTPRRAVRRMAPSLRWVRVVSSSYDRVGFGVRSFGPESVTVRFDNGETHHYKTRSQWKLTGAQPRRRSHERRRPERPSEPGRNSPTKFVHAVREFVEMGDRTMDATKKVSSCWA